MQEGGIDTNCSCYNLINIFFYVRTSFLKWVTLLSKGARFKAIFCFNVLWFCLNLFLYFLFIWMTVLENDCYSRKMFKMYFWTPELYMMQWMEYVCFLFIWFMIWAYLLSLNTYFFFYMLSLYMHHLMFLDIFTISFMIFYDFIFWSL